MSKPYLSIIIPTHNERENVIPLLRAIRAGGDEEKIEVIVVDSALSTDGTLDVVDCPSVRKVASTHASRAKQMHEGAKLAQGEILYFVHADTRPPKNYLLHIREAFLQGAEFGLFSYRFDSDSALLAFNSRFTRMDGLFTGGGDQGFFIKQRTYFEHGGFNTSLPIMEDFDFFWRLKEAGLSYKLIPDDAIVSARKYERNSYLKVQWVNLVTLLGFKWGRDPKRLYAYYRAALN